MSPLSIFDAARDAPDRVAFLDGAEAVSFRAEGCIECVEVMRLSGKRVLDGAAVMIVEMAGPYSPFRVEIRRDTDILNITRTWTFAKGDELHSD